ncbi:VOC family protein [Vibrio sp. PP-XX7]
MYEQLNVVCFDHIQMDVASLEESISFYKNVFGFELKEIGVRAMNRWSCYW